VDHRNVEKHQKEKGDFCKLFHDLIFNLVSIIATWQMQKISVGRFLCHALSIDGREKTLNTKGDKERQSTP